MISVTRRYHFSASHRLHSPELSLAENAQVFGKCNNPFGHGHDYILEISVSGEIDPFTGVILPFSQLDRLVENEVLRLFAHRNINSDVPQFASLVPTTENIALVIADILQQNWERYFQTASARLHRLIIHETARNSFELPLPVRRSNPLKQQAESLAIHA